MNARQTLRPRLWHMAGICIVLAALLLPFGLTTTAVALCPTSNCLPWTIPPPTEGLSAGSRYFGAIQSRQDPRLNSTATDNGECMRYDLADTYRPRNCGALSITRERRVQ